MHIQKILHKINIASHKRGRLLDLLKLKENKMSIEKSTASSSLVEVIDRVLDKGIVVDAWARISLVGIEFLSIEARVVVSGVETYLKYAEAIGLTSSAAAAA